MEVNWKDRIMVNPNICHGRPCIRGTRIWVSLILDLLASGSSPNEILQEYPQLKLEDIQACIGYGAETTRERFIPITVEGLAHEIQIG
jgi:uncharacterized protein (DUF433 family)